MSRIPCPAAVTLCLAVLASPAAVAESVDRLPLTFGYYVKSDTPCAEASNSTLNLVTKTEFNWPQYICALDQIDQTGATTFTVAASCNELNSQQAAVTSLAIFEISDPNSFSLTMDGGDYGVSRFCAQAELPSPWRDNDISDLID